MGRPHERVAAHSPHQGPHRQGDKAKDKAEQHYIAAGQYLKELKDDCPDQKTFLEKVEKEAGRDCPGRC